MRSGKCHELWDGSVTLALEMMEVGQGLGIMLGTLHREYNSTLLIGLLGVPVRKWRRNSVPEWEPGNEAVLHITFTFHTASNRS